MSRRKAFFGVAVLALIGVAVLTRGSWWRPEHASAARAQGQRNAAVPVLIAKAVRKDVPVRIDALGTVTPIASVAIKARIDTAIDSVHFKDGAHVDKGEVLFTLDCRAVDAQIAQTQGTVARDRAQLAGAERDVARYRSLVEKKATSQQILDAAETQADVFRATIEADQGTLQNLKVQRSYCTIKAPIAGRISVANVKVGNFVRQADTTPMATINQMAPVYVTFTVPQNNLPDIRTAIAAKTARIEAVIPGERKPADGVVSMIENTVDSSTGMATIRAAMPNKDERLWPGTLVRTELTLRSEEALVVPTNAVQVSQSGNFVFVVTDDKTVKVQPIEIGREFAGETVVKHGLTAGQVVVTDGQLRLQNGTRVAPRGHKPAAGHPKARAGT